jgi:hypothetical protein
MPRKKTKLLPVRESAGKWILPQPLSAKADGNFTQIPRLNRTAYIPFGYKVNEEDPWVLDPIPLELEALEKAKGYLKRYSSRHVAVWLEKVTGRHISHLGLLKRVRSEQSNKNEASSYWSWAARYKKAIEFAEKYQNRKGSRGYEKAKKLVEAADKLTRPRDKRNINRVRDSGAGAGTGAGANNPA